MKFFSSNAATAFFSWTLVWVWIFCAGPLIACAKSRPVEFAPANFSQLAETVGPAVVNIRIIPDDNEVPHSSGNTFEDKDDLLKEFFQGFSEDEDQEQLIPGSLGSGFIIDKQGYVVTNNHVIEETGRIKVLLGNEKEFDAEVVGRDVNSDLALIKIKTRLKLPIAILGDSDKMKVGQWVVAIGSPFGLAQSVTAGIVSAKGRVIGSGPYDDFIQTDASINPGNSGGPLINMAGEVIGINSAIVAEGSGIGFAIPINMAKEIIHQLLAYGEVTRGWIGVATQDLNSGLADYYGIVGRAGVLVTDVFDDDPADMAGIKPKDIILSINGKLMKDSRDFTKTIADLDVGRNVDVEILRNGKQKNLQVIIGKKSRLEKEDQTLAPERKDALGAHVSNLSPEMVKRFNLASSTGVVVVRVEPDSNAASAGLQIGDIIFEINRILIDDVEAFTNGIDDVESGASFDLLINRIGQGLMVMRMIK